MPRRCSLALLLILLAGPAAAAQPTAKPAPDAAKLEAQEAQAKKACDGGRAQEGTRLLTELLNQTNDGTYIFNLARCYQQNGQLEQALLHFRSYLRRSDVDPAAAARAREYVTILERAPRAPVAASTPASAATTTAAAPSSTATPAPASAAGGAIDVDPPSVAASSATQPPSPGRALRIGGLAVGVAGVASLGVGAAYGWQAHKLSEETARAEERGDRTAEWFLEQNRRGVRAERRQWLFLGAGAAAVAAGGVLYYLGLRAGEPAQAAVLLPVALPGGGGALLGGRF